MNKKIVCYNRTVVPETIEHMGTWVGGDQGDDAKDSCLGTGRHYLHVLITALTNSSAQRF